jgi:hypothetical protein
LRHGWRLGGGRTVSNNNNVCFPKHH